MFHDDEGRRHPQHPGEFAIAAQHLALDFIDPIGHVARVRQHGLPGVGGLVAASLAVEQASAESRFQGIEPAQHGGVVDAELARGAGQRARLGHRERVLEVTPVQIGHGKSFVETLQIRKVASQFAQLCARMSISTMQAFWNWSLQ